MAAFAEILKYSPYADTANLDTLETIFFDQSSRDSDRTAFANFFVTARSLIEDPSFADGQP